MASCMYDDAAEARRSITPLVHMLNTHGYMNILFAMAPANSHQLSHGCLYFVNDPSQDLFLFFWPYLTSPWPQQAPFAAIQMFTGLVSLLSPAF